MSTSYDYDRLALEALLTEDQKGRNARLAELRAHAEGRYTCPDCGHEGPHEVQHGEFACADCGMQHPVPPLPRRP